MFVDVKSISIDIADKPICEDLSFSVESGQRWGILGGNGVGKTTLLMTIAGLLPLAKGNIKITGIDLSLWKRKSLARKLGILFQDSQDTFPMSVMETVLTGRHPHLPFWSFEGERDKAIAGQALLDVTMEDMAQRQINTLSGGERRRLALATLLVQNPLIWLLDEPTNHLDLHQQIKLLDLIIKRVNDVEGSLIMVLHDVNLVFRYCTHVMLMVNHKTTLCGPVAEILTIENLESLYQHPVRMITDKDTRFFYPQ